VSPQKIAATPSLLVRQGEKSHTRALNIQSSARVVNIIIHPFYPDVTVVLNFDINRCELEDVRQIRPDLGGSRRQHIHRRERKRGYKCLICQFIVLTEMPIMVVDHGRFLHLDGYSTVGEAVQ
jgi:hypothetical protein